MKDIFVDNDFVNHNFHTGDENILKFIKWLYDEDDLEEKAHLVFSQKLYAEYLSSSASDTSYTSIIMIIAKMQADGRLNYFGNNQIKTFQTRFMPAKIHKRLTCGRKDRDHIPIVLLSNRKFALTHDVAFLNDLINFRGFNVTAKSSITEIDYL